MEGFQVIMLGALIGIVGALPSAYLFEQALRGTRSVSVAAGLASIFISFAMLSGAIFVVWVITPHNVLCFGVAEAASFLLVWVVEAWRAWRDAHRATGAGERNRGESTGEPTRRD